MAKSVKTPRIRIGDKITCRYPVDAYYSSYGGNPKMIFEPGMVGMVKYIPPKVRIVKRNGEPWLDRHTHFVVVDFDFPGRGTQRVGLNFVNCVPVGDR